MWKPWDPSLKHEAIHLCTETLTGTWDIRRETQQAGCNPDKVKWSTKESMCMSEKYCDYATFILWAKAILYPSQKSYLLTWLEGMQNGTATWKTFWKVLIKLAHPPHRGSRWVGGCRGGWQRKAQWGRRAGGGCFARSHGGGCRNLHLSNPSQLYSEEGASFRSNSIVVQNQDEYFNFHNCSMVFWDIHYEEVDIGYMRTFCTGFIIL
jgi:hypothetical protein